MLTVASSKAKLAGLVANRDPADPAIPEARAGLELAKIRAAVIKWPPLDDETRAFVAAQLDLGTGDA